MKNRFQSPVVWLSVLAQICMIITLFAPQITEQFKIIGTCVIEIATLFGVLNNPNDKENF